MDAYIVDKKLYDILMYVDYTLVLLIKKCARYYEENRSCLIERSGINWMLVLS